MGKEIVNFQPTDNDLFIPGVLIGIRMLPNSFEAEWQFRGSEEGNGNLLTYVSIFPRYEIKRFFRVNSEQPEHQLH